MDCNNFLKGCSEGSCANSHIHKCMHIRIYTLKTVYLNRGPSMKSKNYRNFGNWVGNGNLTGNPELLPA